MKPTQIDAMKMISIGAQFTALHNISKLLVLHLQFFS